MGAQPGTGRQPATPLAVLMLVEAAAASGQDDHRPPQVATLAGRGTLVHGAGVADPEEILRTLALHRPS